MEGQGQGGVRGEEGERRRQPETAEGQGLVRKGMGTQVSQSTCSVRPPGPRGGPGRTPRLCL